MTTGRHKKRTKTTQKLCFENDHAWLVSFSTSVLVYTKGSFTLSVQTKFKFRAIKQRHKGACS